MQESFEIRGMQMTEDHGQFIDAGVIWKKGPMGIGGGSVDCTDTSLNHPPGMSTPNLQTSTAYAFKMELQPVVHALTYTQALQ